MSDKINFTHFEIWFEGKNAPKKLATWIGKHPDFQGEITIDLWDTYCGEDQVDDWHILIKSKEARDENSKMDS